MQIRECFFYAQYRFPVLGIVLMSSSEENLAKFKLQ